MHYYIIGKRLRRRQYCSLQQFNDPMVTDAETKRNKDVLDELLFWKHDNFKRLTNHCPVQRGTQRTCEASLWDLWYTVVLIIMSVNIYGKFVLLMCCVSLFNVSQRGILSLREETTVRQTVVQVWDKITGGWKVNLSKLANQVLLGEGGFSDEVTSGDHLKMFFFGVGGGGEFSEQTPQSWSLSSLLREAPPPNKAQTNFDKYAQRSPPPPSPQ